MEDIEAFIVTALYLFLLVLVGFIFICLPIGLLISFVFKMMDKFTKERTEG